MSTFLRKKKKKGRGENSSNDSLDISSPSTPQTTPKRALAISDSEDEDDDEMFIITAVGSTSTISVVVEEEDDENDGEETLEIISVSESTQAQDGGCPVPVGLEPKINRQVQQSPQSQQSSQFQQFPSLPSEPSEPSPPIQHSPLPQTTQAKQQPVKPPRPTRIPPSLTTENGDPSLSPPSSSSNTPGFRRSISARTYLVRTENASSPNSKPLPPPIQPLPPPLPQSPSPLLSSSPSPFSSSPCQRTKSKLTAIPPSRGGSRISSPMTPKGPLALSSSSHSPQPEQTTHTTDPLSRKKAGRINELSRPIVKQQSWETGTTTTTTTHSDSDFTTTSKRKSQQLLQQQEGKEKRPSSALRVQAPKKRAMRLISERNGPKPVSPISMETEPFGSSDSVLDERRSKGQKEDVFSFLRSTAPPACGGDEGLDQFLRSGPAEKEDDKEDLFSFLRSSATSKGDDISMLSFLREGPPGLFDEEQTIDKEKGTARRRRLKSKKGKTLESCQDEVSSTTSSSSISVVENDIDPDVRYAEGGAKIIKAATCSRLVEALSQEEVSDPKFRDSFLITYRAFSSPEEFLDLLILRYEPNETTASAALTKRRARVVGVLKAWLEQFAYDFSTDEVKDKLSSFLSDMEKTMSSSASQLTKLFQKSVVALEEKREREVEEHSQEYSFSVEMLHAGGWKMVNGRELAQQMSHVESRFYCKILPKECLGWNRKDKDTVCKNICKMIQQFNLVSGWVRTCLVTLIKKSERVEMFKRFIDLMECLKELNNFNGMMEILSGLNSAPVQRMKETIKELGPDFLGRWKACEELLSHQLSYRAYREHLHTISPPCVPYLGVYLTDLTFILDGNPDYVEERLVNFFKFRKVADIVLEIKQYQSGYIDFPESVDVQIFLQSLRPLSEEDCYRWTSKVEPKNVENGIKDLIKTEMELEKKLQEVKMKEKELRNRLGAMKNGLPTPIVQDFCSLPPSPLERLIQFTFEKSSGSGGVRAPELDKKKNKSSKKFSRASMQEKRKTKKPNTISYQKGRDEEKLRKERLILKALEKEKRRSEALKLTRVSGDSDDEEEKLIIVSVGQGEEEEEGEDDFVILGVGKEEEEEEEDFVIVKVEREEESDEELEMEIVGVA